MGRYARGLSRSDSGKWETTYVDGVSRGVLEERCVAIATYARNTVSAEAAAGIHGWIDDRLYLFFPMICVYY